MRYAFDFDNAAKKLAVDKLAKIPFAQDYGNVVNLNEPLYRLLKGVFYMAAGETDMPDPQKLKAALEWQEMLVKAIPVGLSLDGFWQFLLEFIFSGELGLRTCLPATYQGKNEIFTAILNNDSVAALALLPEAKEQAIAEVGITSCSDLNFKTTWVAASALSSLLYMVSDPTCWLGDLWAGDLVRMRRSALFDAAELKQHEDESYRDYCHRWQDTCRQSMEAAICFYQCLTLSAIEQYAKIAAPRLDIPNDRDNSVILSPQYKPLVHTIPVQTKNFSAQCMSSSITKSQNFAQARS
jgi:hypothetical protein